MVWISAAEGNTHRTYYTHIKTCSISKSCLLDQRFYYQYPDKYDIPVINTNLLVTCHKVVDYHLCLSVQRHSKPLPCHRFWFSNHSNNRPFHLLVPVCRSQKWTQKSLSSTCQPPSQLVSTTGFPVAVMTVTNKLGLTLKSWLAQKSNEISPVIFRSVRPLLPIPPLQISQSLTTCALKFYIRVLHQILQTVESVGGPLNWDNHHVF